MAQPILPANIAAPVDEADDFLAVLGPRTRCVGPRVQACARELADCSIRECVTNARPKVFACMRACVCVCMRVQARACVGSWVCARGACARKRPFLSLGLRSDQALTLVEVGLRVIEHLSLQ